MTPDNTEGELTELDDKIISTIKSEFKRPEEIAETTGLTLPQVMKRLRELTADGLVVVRNAKYGTPTTATWSSKHDKLVTICWFILLELFAILGAVPLYGNGRNRDLHTWSLWDNSGALAAFLIGAALLTILYVRKYLRISSIKTQVISAAVVVGILLGSALGANAPS